MRRVLFLLFLFFLFALPSFCQEVVVFLDDRSLTVKSHREKDGFVYLQLNEGEIAVPKKQIKEFRKEEGINLETSTVEPKGLGRELPRQLNVTDRRRPLQVMRNVNPNILVRSSADDEEDEDDESLDDYEEDDEDEPPPQIRPKPVRPMKIDSTGFKRTQRLNPTMRKR